MNVKLLRKVQEYQSAEPRRFAMGAFFRYGVSGHGTVPVDANDANAGNHFEKKQEFPPCGTVGCIAGNACIVALGLANVSDTFDFNGTATKLLKLTLEQKQRLFWASSWPKKFRESYRRARSAKRRVEIANERIDLFIKTGGRK